MKKAMKPLMYAVAALTLMTGTATATALITGAQVQNESLTGADIKNGSLAGNDLAPGLGKITYRTVVGEYSTILPGTKVAVQVLCDYQHGEYAVSGGGRDYYEQAEITSSLPVNSSGSWTGPAFGWRVVLKSDGHTWGKAFAVCAKQS